MSSNKKRSAKRRQRAKDHSRGAVPERGSVDDFSEYDKTRALIMSLDHGAIAEELQSRYLEMVDKILEGELPLTTSVSMSALGLGEVVSTEVRQKGQKIGNRRAVLKRETEHAQFTTDRVAWADPSAKPVFREIVETGWQHIDDGRYVERSEPGT